MKKTRILIAWLLMVGPGAFAQTYYLDNVKVENRSVEKVGRSVKVEMDVVMDGLDMKNQHSLRLVPTLVSADGSQELPLEAIVVNGRVRDKVMARQQSLGEPVEEAQVSLRRKNGKAQTVHYQTEVPFSRWMVDGRLDLRGYVTGCAACSEGDELLATGEILPYEEPQYLMQPVVQPKEEVVKRRSEVRTARLQYRQDSHNVLPGYKDNRNELDKVQASIDAVKENADLTITGIYVTGYASPEATVAYNMELSKRRAQKFVEYVQKQNPEQDKSLWHVDWKGEDWAGLREEVLKHPRLLKQDEVLKIIDECQGDQDACEEKIKALVPPTIYQRVLNEMYGPLRRNEYRIEYNVRHFELEEARRLLNSRPDLLSVAEIQKVADSYGRNSDEYRAALQVAVRTYPDNVTARNNAALAEIETAHYAEAISLLKDVQEPSLINLLGVAYFKNGQLGEARKAFERAQQAGYAGAADNLKMLQEAEEMLE